MTQLIVFLALSGLSGAVFAHVGTHDVGFLNTLIHLLREPDHLLAILAVGAVAIVTIVARLRKTR